MKKYSAFVNEQEEISTDVAKTGGETAVAKTGQGEVAKIEEKKCPDYTDALVNIIKNIQFTIKELNRRNELLSEEKKEPKQLTAGEKPETKQITSGEQKTQTTPTQKPTQTIQSQTPTQTQTQQTPTQTTQVK